MDGQGTKWHRNIDDNFNRLSRANGRYRQTDDRETTDGRTTTYLSSRSLKNKKNKQRVVGNHFSYQQTDIARACIFTALHGMQKRSSDGNSVCPSVCLSVRLSVCETRGLWQNGRKLSLDFYIIRKNVYPSFLRRRMVGGGDPLYLKFWVNRPALERNRRFWTNNRS